MAEISKGSVVRDRLLKGPSMRVTAVTASLATCEWYDSHRRLQTATFCLEVLELEPAPKTVVRYARFGKGFSR